MKDNIFNFKYNGFFLIELLIAIGIFSLTCLIITQFHAKILEQQEETRKFNEALNLANSIIEEMIGLGSGHKSQEFSREGFQVKIELLNQKKGSKSQKTKTLALFNITIGWKFQNKDKKLDLDFGLIT